MPRSHTYRDLPESLQLLARVARMGKTLFNENMMSTSMVMSDMDMDGTDMGTDALGKSPTVVHRGTKQQPGLQTMMKVTGYKDESAKGLLGIGQEFMVDMSTTPQMTNLLDQDGAYVSIDDIKDFFHFEPIGMDPASDSSMRGTEMMQSN